MPKLKSQRLGEQNWFYVVHLRSIRVKRSKVLWKTQTLARWGTDLSPQQAPVLPLSSMMQLSQLLQVTAACMDVCTGVSIIGGVRDDKNDTLQLLSHSRCFSVETQVSCLRSFRLHKNTALASASIDDALRTPLLLPHTTTLVLCI